MADSPTTYTDEPKHHISDDDAPETYAGDFYAEDNTFAAYSIVRARTRFTNESRFIDEQVEG